MASLPFECLFGCDPDGGPVAIATVRLLQDPDVGDETEDDAQALADADLALHLIARESSGPLSASSLSAAVIA